MDHSENYGQPQKHGHYERTLSRFGPPGNSRRPASAGGRAGYKRATRETSGLVATARITRLNRSAVVDRRGMGGGCEDSPGASPLEQLKQHHKDLTLHQHHEQQHHQAAETLQRQARSRIARNTYKGSIGAKGSVTHYKSGHFGAWA